MRVRLLGAAFPTWAVVSSRPLLCCGMLLVVSRAAGQRRGRAALATAARAASSEWGVVRM